MGLTIMTNMSSLNAQRALSGHNSTLATTLSRIASGLRVHSSKDDVASLSMATGIGNEVQTLQQGSRNLSDGISMINTIDGGLGEVSSMIVRLRELASQASTGTVDQRERGTLQLEYSALTNEIDRIATTSQFNGQKLIDGSLAATSLQPVVLQIGSNVSANDRIDLNAAMNVTAVTTTGLGIAGTSIGDATSALNATTQLVPAVQKLANIRGRIGAVQNQLTMALNTQDTTVENLTNAVSTLQDADLAHELASMTRDQIKVQASSAMVGQANLQPQSVLRLLRQ